MTTQLEGVMVQLIGIFHKFAGEEGDQHSLNKREMKELLKAELPNFLKNTEDKSEVDKIMQDLDINKDGELDFKEFVILVSSLTICCNDFIAKELKKRTK